jgi:drug/metabolite transporter (DMT)-like permease
MTDRKATLDGTALATVVVCCVLWGVNQVVVKWALPEVPALAQAAIRSAGALLLLLAWAAWRGIPMFGRDGTLAGGLVAGTLFAVEFACIFVGLQYTAASRMAVFVYLSPFVVAAGMPFVTKAERLAPRQWIGLAIAFAGVAIALGEGFFAPTAGPLQWVGDLLGVGGAVLWAATTLVIRATKLSTAAAEKTLGYQLAVSALLLALMSIAAGESFAGRGAPGLPAGTLAALAFQIVVITFASYLAWFWLVRHYPAARLASFTLLTPLAGVAAGVLLLGEPATPRLLAAAVAVAAGLVLVNRG